MSKAPARAEKRVAAAVLAVSGEGQDLRVFLAERAEALRFFGGYLALPGGVRGPEDGPDDRDGGDGAALRSCALRELFEETGILLDRGMRRAADPARRATLRRELLERASAPHDDRLSPWSDLCATATGEVDLTPVCRICTPPFAPVRYDTVFFLARVPDGERPDIWPGELQGGRFWRPIDALDAWRRGEALIVPPVLILLELLQDGDLDAFRARAAATAAGYESGKLHRVRFTPGVLMASLRTPTLPPATTTNCLIVGEDDLCLIDPATPYPDEQERLCELLDELRSEGRELRGILLTHHHDDHVGAAGETARRYGLTVRAHETTLHRLAPGFGAGVRWGAPIADGERIDLGRAPDGSAPWFLEAIFTPGHDRGHLCFRESRYGALFAGDMISTVSTVIIDPPEGHLRTYLESLEHLERLGRIETATLYPAHGPAVKDGRRVVRQYLRHRRLRERALIDALRAAPGTPAALVRRVYTDVDPSRYALAERSLVAGLEKLAEEGRALKDAAGVWRTADATDG